MITVMFSQSLYSVNEDAGPAQPVLVISNPLLIDITVQVTSSDQSVGGEYCSILISYGYYNSMINMLQEQVWIILLDHTLSHFLLK